MIRGLSKNSSLDNFGFNLEHGGAHLARTMMFSELDTLLNYVDNPSLGRPDYLHAIKEENCLGKRSGKTRILSYRHLVALYSLDPSQIVFRALLFFWSRDIAGRPLLALTCTYIRDPLFRRSASFILKIHEGSIVSRVCVEEMIEIEEPGKYSPATLKSAAQNINSTLTQSGHLEGRNVKRRVLAHATPGSVGYALLLGYLAGARGQLLFQTEYIKLLDCSFDKALELAEDASRRGWIVLKRVGDVVEVLFPNIINQEERELLREQN